MEASSPGRKARGIAHQAYDNSNSHGPHSNGQQSQGAGSYRQQPHHQDRSWSDGDGDGSRQSQRDANNQYSRAKQYQDRRHSGQQSQQQENSYVGHWTPPPCGGAQASAQASTDKVRTPKAGAWSADKRSQQVDKGHGGQQSRQKGTWDCPPGL